MLRPALSRLGLWLGLGVGCFITLDAFASASHVLLASDPRFARPCVPGTRHGDAASPALCLQDNTPRKAPRRSLAR
ncbi:hypothetical protein GQ53DRAFT_750910 [Thozetella sp. PMI_491]|nr:hypothetical protein GQ53DRAFT_750910 [Thozetella sp. PMI_491]